MGHPVGKDKQCIFSSTPLITLHILTLQDTKSEERGEEGQEEYSESGGVGQRRRGSVFEQMKNIPTAGISSDSPRRPSLRRNSVSSENNQSQIDLGGSQVRRNLVLLTLSSDCFLNVLGGKGPYNSLIGCVAFLNEYSL